MAIKPNSKLWQALKECGLTQRQFAAMVGDHYSKISMVVTGRLLLTDEEKERYAAAVNKTAKELFA